MSTAALNIIFMGTPDFAVPALQSLIDSHHNVIAVYSQPPRPKGRGHNLQKSPVHMLAEKNDIPVITPKKLKKNNVAINDFIGLNADIAVVAAYGLILPKDVLEAPKYGCLNIHASLLPRWRGAAPIQYAIWKGDSETGVTIMQMEQGLDTGSMISKIKTDITDTTTAQKLHDRLSMIGADEIVTVLDDIQKKGAPEAQAQDDTLSTYASMLSKEDGIINWTQDAHEIDCQIRALNPWPGTHTRLNSKIFKIKAATVKTERHESPNGTLLNRDGDVACESGSVLRISAIQPEGKAPMNVRSAINGSYLKVGDVFT